MAGEPERQQVRLEGHAETGGQVVQAGRDVHLDEHHEHHEHHHEHRMGRNAVVAIVAVMVLLAAGAVVWRWDDVAGRLSTGYPHITVGPSDSVQINGAWTVPVASFAGTGHLDGLDAARRSPGTLDTYQTAVLVHLAATPGHTVVFTGIKLKILSRRKPTSGGTLIVYPPQGEDPVVQLGFDLDQPDPVVLSTDQNRKTFGKPYFSWYQLSLSGNQAATLGFTFQAIRSDVSYVLEFEETIDGKTVPPQEVDDGGKPFRTSGFADSYGQVLAPSRQGVGWSATTRADAINQMCGSPCYMPMVDPTGK